MNRRAFLAATTASLAATQLAGPAYASASSSAASGSTAGHYEVVARFWGAMPTGVTSRAAAASSSTFPAGATTSRSPSPNCAAGSRWPTPTPR